MFQIIKDNILRPLLGRIGTATTGLLVGMGVSNEPAHQIGLGVGAAGLLIGDFLIDFLNRRHAVNKAIR